MHEAITSFVHDIAGISIDIMELLSIGIILFTTVQAFVKLLKRIRTPVSICCTASRSD